MSNWWYERWMKPKPSLFGRSDYMLGVWENKAVYSREEIESMLRRGEISEKRAEEMLHLTYKPVRYSKESDGPHEKPLDL